MKEERSTTTTRIFLFQKASVFLYIYIYEYRWKESSPIGLDGRESPASSLCTLLEEILFTIRYILRDT